MICGVFEEGVVVISEGHFLNITQCFSGTWLRHSDHSRRFGMTGQRSAWWRIRRTACRSQRAQGFTLIEQLTAACYFLSDLFMVVNRPFCCVHSEFFPKVIFFNEICVITPNWQWGLSICELKCKYFNNWKNPVLVQWQNKTHKFLMQWEQMPCQKCCIYKLILKLLIVPSNKQTDIPLQQPSYWLSKTKMMSGQKII